MNLATAVNQSWSSANTVAGPYTSNANAYQFANQAAAVAAQRAGKTYS
jgi:hypothetical protein